MKPLKDYMLDPPDVIYPRCPVCGEECEKVYRSEQTAEIIGSESARPFMSASRMAAF